MNKTHILRVALLAGASAALAFRADATVVDVSLDGYVTDGLIANWDGVFNKNSSVYHDSSATVWKDLVSGRVAEFHAVTDRTGGIGHWATNGYYFAGASYAQLTEDWAFGSTFTVQVVCDYTLADQADIAYPNYFAAPSDFCMFTQKNATTVQWKTDPAGESSRPRFSGWKGQYLTAIWGADTMYLTQTDKYANAVTRAGSQNVAKAKWCFGGSANGPKDRVSIGTIHAVRIYSRPLNEDELAANRAVDERRFRNGKVGVDVVVAPDALGLCGDVPPGTYGVAGSHIFRAPSIVETNGTTYALSGYRLEKWDAEEGVWTNAVTSFSSMYRHVPNGETVRLTWLWSAEGGLQRYQVSDYVQGGLKAQFDGICNAGIGTAHAESPEKWMELVSDGAIAASFYENTNTMSLGAWTATGYAFNGHEYARTDSALPALGMECTVQAVLDCDTSAQSDIHYPNYFSYTAGDFGMFTVYGGSSVTWKMDTITGAPWIIGDQTEVAVRASFASWQGKYLNGVITPTSIGVFQTTSTNDAVFQSRVLFREMQSAPWLLGGALSSSDDGGTAVRGCRANFQGLRLYNRVLTDGEMALNRDIDEVRFRNAKPAANGIEVATATAGLEGFEPSGTYRLYGTYRFSAPSKLKLGGRVYRPLGCAVATWDDANSEWGAAEWHPGSACTLEADGTAMRRLTWSWAECGFKMIVR